MSRFHRVIHAVAAGYVVLVVTVFYSLVSVPLALHYLSPKRFALWALMSSIAGYLSLIDFGMTSSLARLLIDHKDARAGGTYGSLIKTGWLVMAVQALIIWVAALLLAPVLAQALDISPELRLEFINLVRWQSGVVALGFSMRVFGQILYAHQRLEVVNYSQVAALLMSFIVLAFCFHRGMGVFSLVWAALTGAFFTNAVQAVGCFKLSLLPRRGELGRVSWEHFREIFDFGKDMFLIAVGNQLITASQTMIITRVLGLEVAALWAIGTRVFTLVSQVIWRICDVSGPAFSEMMARGEQSVLRQRYKSVLMLTASLSGFVAVGFALCNSLFITVWTSHKFAWPAPNDVVLGLWMIVLAILHCHNTFVLLTKQVGFMRYIYFVEGIVFVAAAFLAARWGGLPAIIACSVLCSVTFSGLYGIWRISKYFDLSMKEVGLSWLAPMGRVLLLLLPVALVIWWAGQGVRQPATRLALNASLIGPLGFFLLLRSGLSPGLQRELLLRAPQRITPLLRRVFPASIH